MNTAQAIARADASFEAACLAGIDEQERQAEAIAERAEELTREGGRYYPFDADNFAETVGEAPTETLAQLIGLMRDGFTASEGASRLLYLSQEYWDKRADQRARADIERERNAALQYEGDRA